MDRDPSSLQQKRETMPLLKGESRMTSNITGEVVNRAPWYEIALPLLGVLGLLGALGYERSRTS
jgi:hypothetical protein